MNSLFNIQSLGGVNNADALVEFVTSNYGGKYGETDVVGVVRLVRNVYDNLVARYHLLCNRVQDGIRFHKEFHTADNEADPFCLDGVVGR